MSWKTITILAITLSAAHINAETKLLVSGTFVPSSTTTTTRDNTLPAATTVNETTTENAGLLAGTINHNAEDKGFVTNATGTTTIGGETTAADGSILILKNYGEKDRNIPHKGIRNPTGGRTGTC